VANTPSCYKSCQFFEEILEGWYIDVRSCGATVGKIDGPTVRCNDGVDGDGVAVPRSSNTESTKAICLSRLCANYVLDNAGLGWMFVDIRTYAKRVARFRKPL